MKLKVSHSMPHTKSITIGISYRSPYQPKFLGVFFNKIYLNSTQAIVKFTFQAISSEIFFITGNMFLINPLVVAKTQIHSQKSSMNAALFSVFKQLIKCPTRVTVLLFNSSSIVDHVVASFPDRFSQKDVTDARIS